MKKTIKLFSLLILTILLTGCIKYDVSMEVGKDKSVAISIINASKNNMDSGIDPSEVADNLENKGYIKELYKEDSWSGYKMIKTYDNIDDISTIEPITVELSDLLDENKEDIKVFFQKKESVFKTTYIANFTININANEDASTNDKYDSYKDSMELKYTVKLPTPSTKQNTTAVSTDGRTLSWNLEYGKINKINYEFSMVNPITYVMIVIVAILIVSAIIFILFKSESKKKDNVNTQKEIPVKYPDLENPPPIIPYEDSPIKDDKMINIEEEQ